MNRDPELRARIVGLLSTGDWRNHLQAAEDALAVLQPVGGAALLLPPLLEIVSDTRRASHLRVRAVCMLHQMGDARAAPRLTICLRDRDARVRYHAAYALAHLGDAAAVPGLMHVLRHDADADTRYRAAYALGVLGDRSASPALIAALRDEKLHVQHSAATALGKLGDPGALPHLTALLGSESPRVRAAAEQAIQTINPNRKTL